MSPKLQTELSEMSLSVLENIFDPFVSVKCVPLTSKFSLDNTPVVIDRLLVVDVLKS